MESNSYSRQVKITRLLPFMNRKFFELFFEKNKIRVSDIKIENENNLPNYAILSFVNKSYKEDFVNSYQWKAYDNLSHKISLEEITSSSSCSAVTYPPLDQITPQIIKFPILYNKLIETSYERTLCEPGLIFTDKVIIEKQDKVISFLIKKIGSTLIKGKSIMSISLPVNIFDKRTLLQVMAYEMSMAPIFLSRAYYSVDVIERLKWSTTLLIAQLHLSPLQTKPFSPILGETFQCKIGDLNVYIEQSEHKPNITFNFYMVASDHSYKVTGHMTIDASTGANSVKAKKTGNFVIEFKDGVVHELYFPRVHIKGTTFGKRLFNFKQVALVEDRKNNIASYIKFNPDEKGGFVSIFSSKQKSYPDTFRGDIVALRDIKFDKNGKHTKYKDSKSLCKIEGEWTNYLSFDGQKYWTVKDYEPIPLYKMKYTLPSDSTNRKDLNYLLQDDEVNAQAEKEKLEEIQRTDRKLRK